MATRTPNECSNTDREECREFGTTPQFISAIDFGTTHCSVAYLLRQNPKHITREIDPTVLKLDKDWNRRVPSCILFDPSGKKIAFGPGALDYFAALDRKLRPLYHYFEHVKMHLQHDEVT